MSELLIVTCTRAKNSAEFEARPIYKSLNRHYDSGRYIDFHVFKNNKQGLSQCYNQILRDSNNINKTVLFVHDDVELEDMFLADKLFNSPYVITGLAGAKSFDKRSQKAAWHICSPREDHVGEVAHYNNGKTWTTVFGPTKSRALTLDGLFLSCKVKDVVEAGLEFDEEFNFHFYDLAFCMRANEKKIKCGVLPIRVVHHGLGDSMLTNNWEQANARFKQKYCI